MLKCKFTEEESTIPQSDGEVYEIGQCKNKKKKKKKKKRKRTKEKHHAVLESGKHELCKIAAQCL